MEPSGKNWAQEYISGPLTEPAPSDETGLNSHFRPDASTSATPVTPHGEPRQLSSNNPFRQGHGVAKEATVSSAEKTYPSPPPSASPRHSRGGSGSHRSEFLGQGTQGTRPRRSSSLRERFPGDPSVRPLEQLAKEKQVADRARHTTKKHAIRPDTIDSLDASGLGQYHHEGPFDATLFARNNSKYSSPVAALAQTNEEALRATPHDKVVDSVQRHHPLDGVAAYPPGMTDRNGFAYNYKEGENMMTEENAGGGPYKRWAGVQYHPDDIKGKGEPSYSIEKALKEHSLEEREAGVELQDTNRRRSSNLDHRAEVFGNDNDSSGIGRKTSLSDRVRRRVGSMRKKHDE
ncbi:hypothetical protein LTR70_007911 [Exophiala xenobiotica]|uniref:Uncharacterized protein n=1 Tax=Lithohypha guttulata TaxID=1690604 RepID=A0ABR0K8J9_9EURO|nr:hypothetical protein LTR24_005587 [Lithohypha guttulata]KAK5312916.1 hypothetical protein LTR70_007911 [Exophiala xenobiotica]